MESHHRPASFSPADFAAQLSVSRSHLYNLISRGQVRVKKLGHRTVIPATELDRLLALPDIEEVAS